MLGGFGREELCTALQGPFILLAATPGASLTHSASVFGLGTGIAGPRSSADLVGCSNLNWRSGRRGRWPAGIHSFVLLPWPTVTFCRDGPVCLYAPSTLHPPLENPVWDEAELCMAELGSHNMHLGDPLCSSYY